MLITMRIIHIITVFTCLLNVINGFRYHQEKIHKPNNEYYLEQMKYSPVSNENEFMWQIKNKFTAMKKNNFNDAQYDYELQKLDMEQNQMLNDNIEDQETASLSESPKTSYTLPSSQDISKYDEIDDGIQTTSLSSSSSSSSSSYPSDQNMIRSAEIVQKPTYCENLKCQINNMINSNDKNVQNYYANIRKGEVFIHRPAPVIVKRPPTKILVNHPPIIVKPAPVVFHRPPSVLMHPLIIKNEPQPVKVQPVYVKVIRPPERKVIINETNLNGNGMGNDVDANVDADIGLNNHNQHDDNNYLEDSKDFI